MKVLVIGHNEENRGILVQIDCEKMTKKITKLAQTDRAKAMLEILAKGCILRIVEAEEFGSLDGINLMIRESGACWDLN
ncbi:MAG: hypothetical protein KJ995_06430 [Candidatus Omnitrophica bacterium]|nr:hypothetical protein [Candidatus Omnitrophota bacterium]MBU1128235.1 hypothetical protein [Candidatus Omnitrophota bacterium]MBU1784214.1 hypothetical protein [Candidatus Omnitrophota bacterium]MBU1852019.1 hypothetical protein [Candidatus Omnitrophota bacterium]